MLRIHNKPGNSNQDTVDHITHLFPSVPKGSIDSHVDQDVASGPTAQWGRGRVQGFLMRWPPSMTHWISGCQGSGGRYQHSALTAGRRPFSHGNCGEQCFPLPFLCQFVIGLYVCLLIFLHLSALSLSLCVSTSVYVSISVSLYISLHLCIYMSF